MILTGPEIARATERGDITITPFTLGQLNPNSYNYRLGERLIVISTGDSLSRQESCETITAGGFVLLPGILYLGHTVEQIGSSRYVTTLLGRSSVGRLGLFLNITADLGHVGSISRWTLELAVVQPLRVYPGMLIGQVAFWEASGPSIPYLGRYHGDLGPVRNLDPFLNHCHSASKQRIEG